MRERGLRGGNREETETSEGGETVKRTRVDVLQQELINLLDLLRRVEEEHLRRKRKHKESSRYIIVYRVHIESIQVC